MPMAFSIDGQLFFERISNRVSMISKAFYVGCQYVSLAALFVSLLFSNLSEVCNVFLMFVSIFPKLSMSVPNVFHLHVLLFPILFLTFRTDTDDKSELQSIRSRARND